MNEQVFLLPDLGEGLSEAELVQWLVSIGDEVRVDQPVAEVETAKSVVEVPTPFAGTVAVLHGSPGQMLDVGKPLVSILAADSAAGGTAAAPETEVEREPKREPKPEAERMPPAGAVAVASGGRTERTEELSGNVLIGYGTRTGAAGRTRPRKAGVPVSSLSSGPGQPAGAVAVVSPLIRKLARTNGVQLSDVDGSGPGGLILRRDVEAAAPGTAADAAPTGITASTGITAPRAKTAPPANTAEPANTTEPANTAEPANTTETPGVGMAVDSMTGLPVASREALRGARRTAAAMYSRSRREIPEATVWVDADVTALVQLREELKTRDAVVPGMLAFVARFVTAGLARYPQLNSRFDDEPAGGEVVTFAGVNLGFAAQTDRGLVVPAVEHAELLTARQLDAEIRRLTAAARSGTASTAELGRGTFTLNNYGVFGVDGSAAILNYPQAAMLGLGRVLERPWVVAGELAVRQVAQLTLVFDHRVCDGETAAGFLRFVADSLDNPVMALADL